MIKRNFLLYLFCMTFIFMGVACDPIRHLIHDRPHYPGIRSNPEIQSLKLLPLQERLTAYFKTHPDNFYELRGPCGNPQMEANMEIEELIKGESTRTLITLLEHKSPNVRGVAHSLISRRGENTMDVIKKAYEKGNARIRFELFNYLNGLSFTGGICVNQKISDEVYNNLNLERGKILDEIIADKKLPVFNGDVQHFRIYYSKALKDYPFDVIGYYIRLMESDYILYKGEAIDALGGFRADAARAVPALIKILDEKDQDFGYSWGRPYGRAANYTLHQATIIALGNIGPTAKDSIPLIVAAQGNQNLYFQIYATTSLYLIGHEPEKNFQILVDKLNDENSSQLLPTIIMEFGRIGTPAKSVLPEIMAFTKSDNREVRMSAFNAIPMIEGPTTELSETVFKLRIENIKHPNPEVRIESIEYFERSTEFARAEQAITEALGDPDPKVKFAACDAIFKHNKDGKIILPALKEVCEAKPPIGENNELLYLIKSLGDDAKLLMPSMVNMLYGQQAYQSKQIMEMIISLGGSYEMCTGYLAGLLSDEDANVQRATIDTLEDMKDKAAPALPALYKFIKTNERKDGLSANNAILEIVRSLTAASKTSTQDLLPLMEINDRSAIKTVTEAVLRIGGDTNALAKKLGEISAYGSTDHSGDALREIANLGGKGLPALGMLPKSFHREGGALSYLSKDAALKILKSIDEKTKVSIPDLLGLLTSSDRAINKAAIKAITTHGGDYDSIVKKLCEVVKTSEGNTREIAMETLGELGGKAMDAIPTLQEVEKSKANPGMYDARRAINAIMSSAQNDPVSSMETMLLTLESGTDQDVVDHARKIIETTGNKEVVINRLCELSTNENVDVSEHALWALGSLGADSAGALPILIKQGKQRFANREFCYAIICILKKIKPETEVSHEALMELMGTGNNEMVRTAVKAYQAVGGDNERLIDHLIEISKNPDRNVSLEAIQNLQNLGAKAVKALPTLRTLPPRDKDYNSILKSTIREIEYRASIQK